MAHPWTRFLPLIGLRIPPYPSDLWSWNLWNLECVRQWVACATLKSRRQGGFRRWLTARYNVVIRVCLKIVYPYTQWLMIIIPTKWLFFWGYTPFSDIPIRSFKHPLNMLIVAAIWSSNLAFRKSPEEISTAGTATSATSGGPGETVEVPLVATSKGRTNQLLGAFQWGDRQDLWWKILVNWMIWGHP